MNEQQKEELRKPLAKYRVRELKGMSYLEGWDVVSKLNYIFDFDGWSKYVLNTWQIFESENDGKWTICYGATVRLTIGDKISEDSGAATAINQPSRGDAHDQALKSAVTDALKRCAMNLGNQFGLSLYNNGSLNVSYGKLDHAETDS